MPLGKWWLPLLQANVIASSVAALLWLAAARRLYGLQGCDDAHDDRWWFDHLDAEMKARNWNGCRDRAAARKDAA